jgi:hypothetical protein
VAGCNADVVVEDALGRDATDGRAGGGEGAAVDALATLGLRAGARSGVRGAAGATDCRFVWLAALEVAGGEVTLAGRVDVDVDAGRGAATLEGRDLGAGAFGFGAAAFGAGCEMIWRMSVSFTKSPCWGGQSKYRSPRTEPSFFPVGSCKSMPSQAPSAT